MRSHNDRAERLLALVAAVAAPSALSALLVAVGAGTSRDYAFLYLGIVAVLGVASGLAAALVAAGASFVLVDFFFVRPVHTLGFADSTDLLNLCVFFGAAGLVGTFGSRRRAAQLRAEALTRELQRANVELARLAETERQVRVLEETDRVRRELLADVSHDLRTPLASILIGTTGLLQRNELPDDMRIELDTLATEARRLSRLVSDILDMSRIERGIVDIRRDEVDVREAIGAAVERLHRQCPDRPVRVEVPASLPDVMADWDRLGQVLDNLLDNADRAAPPGSPVRVTARRMDGGDVVIRVIDRGPGVPATLQAHVFERFVRGEHAANGLAPGLGLGLPIVRGLIEAHGGRVWLEEPESGEGAHFAFSLPAPDGATDPGS